MDAMRRAWQMGHDCPRQQILAYVLRQTSGPRESDPKTRLTPTEFDVARMVVQGLTSREVAESMFVSTRTVEAHVRHIYRKLGVNSRRQLREMASQIPELGPFDT